VYLTRGERTRKLVRLRYGTAFDPRLEIEDGLVNVGLRIFPVSRGPCRRWVVGEETRPGYGTSTVDVQRGRVWFVRERVEAYGGGDSELVTAALHSDCRVQLLGEPVGGFPEEPMLAYSVAVDGDDFYVGTESGLYRGSFNTADGGPRRRGPRPRR
jgi:hypothetical protein